MSALISDTNPDLLRGHWSGVGSFSDCRASLNKHAFRLTHALGSHPLFTVDALLGVAREASRRSGDVYFDAGDVRVGDKWGGIPVPDQPVEDVIRRIEHAGAWIIMKHVELNPAYGEVLKDWADFMRSLAGDSAHLLTNPEMLVLITSPRRLTPFHFDAELNVLVQLHGQKTLFVCDPQDRSVVAETDIENYYGVSVTAGKFQEHAHQAATAFHLSPGDAVHIPVHSGHWVQNQDEVSVSLSLNFELPPASCSDVYLANFHLRRMGLMPRPPGQSRLVDSVKVRAMQAARSVKRIRRATA